MFKDQSFDPNQYFKVIRHPSLNLHSILVIMTDQTDPTTAKCYSILVLFFCLFFSTRLKTRWRKVLKQKSYREAFQGMSRNSKCYSWRCIYWRIRNDGRCRLRTLSNLRNAPFSPSLRCCTCRNTAYVFRLQFCKKVCKMLRNQLASNHHPYRHSLHHRRHHHFAIKFVTLCVAWYWFLFD